MFFNFNYQYDGGLINYDEMNKGRRHELKMLRYKKRVKKWGVKDVPQKHLYAFRSHGSPCSCICCQQPEDSYKRATEKEKLKKFVYEFYSVYGEMMSQLAYE